MPDDVRAPSPLTDGVVVLDRYRADDVDAHLAGEDEETARRIAAAATRPARSRRAARRGSAPHRDPRNPRPVSAPPWRVR